MEYNTEKGELVMQNISERIKTLRQQKNMTQKDLAEKLHLSNNVVSKWELGQSEPDINALYQLARIFDISIGELFGEEVNQTKQEKNFNQKCYEFFKNHYLLIIQIVLTSFAIICACAGFGWLIDRDVNDFNFGDKLGVTLDILPNYTHWILLWFSIAVGILQIIVSLVERRNRFITIIKFVLLTLCLGFMIAAFVFLSLIEDGYFQKYFIVCGVTYALFSISIFLNCLVELKALKTRTPLKLGKILTVLMFVFIGLECGFTAGSITTASVAFGREYYDQRTPRGMYFDFTNWIDNSSCYALYNIGDTLNTKLYYPENARKEKIHYKSYDTQVATINQDGKITAVGFGSCTIEAYVKSGVRTYVTVKVISPKISNAESSYSSSFKFYPNAQQTISLRIENYKNNYDEENFHNLEERLSYQIECEQPYEVISYKIENGHIYFTLIFPNKPATTYSYYEAKLIISYTDVDTFEYKFDIVVSKY